MSSSLFNRQAYDIWSKQYDHEPNSTIAVDDRHFPAVWQHLTGAKVLEIGCGTGRHTHRLVEQGNHLTAIEPSPGMLELARNKIDSARVNFISGDFLTHENFPDAPFDAIIESLVIEHIEDLPSFFKKVSKLLRPGGEFFMSEIHPLRIAQGSQARFLDPATKEEVLLKSFAHKEAEILDAARAANLSAFLNLDLYGDQELAALQPSWDKYLGRAMVKILGFR